MKKEMTKVKYGHLVFIPEYVEVNWSFLFDWN